MSPIHAWACFKRRTITRTASQSRLLSLGSCISAGCDRAVEAHDAAVLNLVLPGARQQPSIDRLPGLGADRADRLVQHRFLRAPRPRQAGEGPERGGVLEMEGQLLVAQLAVLLEKRTAQHRLCGQTVSSRLLHPIAAQVGCD